MSQATSLGERSPADESRHCTTGDRSVLSIHTGATRSGVPGVEVALVDELCAFSAPFLRDHVDQLIDGGVTHIDFELGELTMCSAAGLSVFDHVEDRLHDNGGELALHHAGGVVKRVIDIARLFEVGADVPGVDLLLGLGDGAPDAVRVRADIARAVLGRSVVPPAAETGE